MFEFWSECDCPYCDEFNRNVMVCFNANMDPVRSTHDCEECGETFTVIPDEIDRVECSSEKIKPLKIGLKKRVTK